MGNLSDPLCAGLPYVMGVCADSSVFVQFQAIKLTGVNTFAPCATTDGNDDVWGVVLADRGPGDSLSIPVVPITSALALPTLSDGSNSPTAASATLGFLTLSGTVAGRFKAGASGILRARTSCGSVQDRIVMANSIAGSGSSSGAGTLGASYIVGGGTAGSNNTLGSAASPMDSTLTLIMTDGGAARLSVQSASLTERIAFSVDATSGGIIRGGDSTTGSPLLIRAGDSSTIGTGGATMLLRSGAGGAGDGVTVAGRGGDLEIIGNDAGAAGAAGGSTGGNVYIGGGLGTNAVDQHGGILIGTEDTTPGGRVNRADEIRIGHEPGSGINLGHIRLTGHIAPAGTGGAPLSYRIRLEYDSNPAIIDAATGPAAGNAGTPVTFRSGAGAAGSGVTAGAASGALILETGAGGAGVAGAAAGASAAITIRSGAAGADGGGGGANTGAVNIDAGQPSGAGVGGIVSLGTVFTQRVDIGHSAAGVNIDAGAIDVDCTTIDIGGTVTFSGFVGDITLASDNTRTISVRQRQDANSDGRTLMIIGSQGNGTGNGGNTVVVGANRGASGTFGGSLIFDGGNGSSAANGGVILIGTDNAASGGRTASVSIGNATSTLGFYAATPVAKQTGVAVTAAAIHTALSNLGLIAA